MNVIVPPGRCVACSRRDERVSTTVTGVPTSDRRRRGQFPTAVQLGGREQTCLRGVGGAAARDSGKPGLGRLGVEKRATDNLEALPLGTQQRVQLGAGFVHAPQLPVLAEPFSGLDPVGIDSLGAVLRDVAAGGAT